MRNLMETLISPQKKETLISHADIRHRWHSFPAKYPPELPAEFILKYTNENETVLDPMFGSATTLIETQKYNRKSIGIDIDPLSIINAKGKLNVSNPDEIKRNYHKIVDTTSNLSITDSSDSEEIFESQYTQKTKDFIRYWFPQENINALVVLSKQIANIDDEAIRDFYFSILSSIIITKNGNVCYAADLAHTRPHKVTNKKILKPYTEFDKKFNKIVQEHMQSYNSNRFNRPVIIHGDAKKCSLDSNSIDLVITSPPYANNAIDYLRAHKFALVWMGYSIEQISDMRKTMIGEESAMTIEHLISGRNINKIVNHISLLNKSKGRKLSKYYLDMYMVIKEMYRVLKPNKHAVLVVASSIMEGMDILTHECIIELAEIIGFELSNVRVREIDRNKRMLPVSTNVKVESQIESRMHSEFIIDLKKG